MARALHEHLGVPADALLKKPCTTFGPAPTRDALRRFPWREMVNRKWLEHRSNLRDYAEEMYGKLESRAGGKCVMTPALLRENGHRRMNAKTNHYALWVWCLRVLGNAKENEPQCDYVPGVVDEDFMREVAQCSTTADGTLRAREHLARHGIALVVEKHLKNTYLNGEVLRLGSGRPVIGLTLGYDRIDNFWFTLNHEPAHVSLHLEDNGNAAFFDDLDLKESSRMEKEADELAENALSPPELLKQFVEAFHKGRTFRWVRFIEHCLALFCSASALAIHDLLEPAPQLFQRSTMPRQSMLYRFRLTDYAAELLDLLRAKKGRRPPV